MGGVNTYAYVNGNSLSFVDPDGLVRIDQSCSAKSAEILAAEAKIRQKIDESCMQCDTGGCIPCKDAQKLKLLLDRVEVKCAQSNNTPVLKNGQWSNTGISACAWQGGIGMTITPRGFIKKSCGCLESVMLHELLHIPEYRVGQAAENWILGVQRKCFNCSK